ncbi:hypothetical protein K438DRAFT_1991167 [Mycena galopus ATCC 62051]|nr:hypothetical protein K438DRAFT_1991167 [Mycena galopus ATCC 62051]
MPPGRCQREDCAVALTRTRRFLSAAPRLARRCQRPSKPPRSVTCRLDRPQRGPRSRVDTHASVPLCGAAPIATHDPRDPRLSLHVTGTVPTRGPRSCVATHALILLWGATPVTAHGPQNRHGSHATGTPPTTRPCSSVETRATVPSCRAAPLFFFIQHSQVSVLFCDAENSNLRVRRTFATSQCLVHLIGSPRPLEVLRVEVIVSNRNLHPPPLSSLSHLLFPLLI